MPNRRVVPIALALLMAAATARATLLDIQLDMGSLPSAQGFTYASSMYDGSAYVGIPEPQVFSVGGGVLTQNTLSVSFGRLASYEQRASISFDHPAQLRVTARCVTYQSGGYPEYSQPGAFAFTFANGRFEYGFLITPLHVGVVSGGGWRLSDPIYDNTEFHEYRFESSPGGVWQLYRDDVVVFAGAFGRAETQRYVKFGDLDIGSDVHGEIGALRFTQETPTPTAPSTWGRIKSLYR